MHFCVKRHTTTIAFYDANVQSASDYYAFSQLLPGRNAGENYRFGFNGHEKDDEIKGSGNHLSFGDEGYDPRIGRRWQLDPEPTFGISEYAAFNNNPILFADPDGKFPIIPIIAAAYYISSKIMEKSEGNAAVRTVGYSMRHPVNAFKTNGPFLTNHNDVATNFQVNIGKALGVKNVEGGVQNAIRHTLWQALLTKDMGAKAASRIGNAHETTTNVDMNQRVFKGVTAKDDADRTIDLLNNQIGRSIGEQNKDADNVTTAKAVVTEYYKNGLYTMTGNDKDGYKIQKTKLTKDQYETAIKEIDKKGQDGMNKSTDEKK
jgi:RHS repeat-associated protein